MNPSLRDPDAWKDAWARSMRLQRALRLQGKSEYYVQAQREHDFCKAVDHNPESAHPTAEEWFCDENVPLSDAGTVSHAERPHDLHVVRPADSVADRAAKSAAVNGHDGFDFSAASGKLFLSYKSPQERLHHWNAPAPTTAPSTRWQAIAKDRGGSYSTQVKKHAWAALYIMLGVIIGAFSRGNLCR